MSNKKNYMQCVLSGIYDNYETIKEQLIVSIIVSLVLLTGGFIGKDIAIQTFTNEFIAQIFANAVFAVHIVAIVSFWIAQIIVGILGCLGCFKTNNHN